MNNSEPPLSNREEKLTLYLDGALSAEDTAAFEKEYPDALQERARCEQFRKLIVSNPPILKNGDFFNHQILREIETPPARASQEKTVLFPLWRLASAAAACLLIATGVYFAFVRAEKVGGRDYFAQVLNVKAGDDELSAQIIDADGVAVVWIDGLDSLSTEYVLE
jgi:anti-sigma factor RsiW